MTWRDQYHNWQACFTLISISSCLLWQRSNCQYDPSTRQQRIMRDQTVNKGSSLKDETGAEALANKNVCFHKMEICRGLRPDKHRRRAKPLQLNWTQRVLRRRWPSRKEVVNDICLARSLTLPLVVNLCGEFWCGRNNKTFRQWVGIRPVLHLTLRTNPFTIWWGKLQHVSPFIRCREIAFGRNKCFLPLEIDASFPDRVFIWSSSRTQHKAWPLSSFISLSAYRHDPVAGQISVTQHTDVATNNPTFKYLPQFCWGCLSPLTSGN